MKVSNITNKQINMKSFTIFNKVKKRLLQAHVQLKTMVRDVFEKKTSDNVQKGKELSDKNLPSFIWGENDYKGTKVINLKFYPEDIEKMKNMTSRERIEYKKQLMRNKQYSDGDVIGSI